MNTKAIQLLTRAPAFGTRFIIYTTMAAAALASICYIGSTASYFFLASHSSEQHGFVSKLGDDVLTQIGTINDGRLSEISGIVASSRYPETFWVHNDSGNPAELFLIDQGGAVLARLQLKGAKNRDWEDICAFRYKGQLYLCVGDVGDNCHQHLQRRDRVDPCTGMHKCLPNRDSSHLLIGGEPKPRLPDQSKTIQLGSLSRCVPKTFRDIATMQRCR